MLMHRFIQPVNGWETEMLRDEGDDGCSFIEEVKKTHSYAAKIRYEEHEHNKKITIEGIVYRHNGDNVLQKTLKDALFLEEKVFEEENCRPKAAAYACELKQRIDVGYF